MAHRSKEEGRGDVYVVGISIKTRLSSLDPCTAKVTVIKIYKTSIYLEQYDKQETSDVILFILLQCLLYSDLI